MKSLLVKFAVILTAAGSGWSQPSEDLSITTPDGKTTVIHWASSPNQAKQGGKSL